MARTFVMIFKNERKLNAMIEFRKNGWTLKSLAILYGVDHSSIYKACKIRKVRPMNRKVIYSFDIPGILSSVGIEPKHEKTYQDYLEEARRRRYPKLYSHA